jgi:hypothetical protein
MQWIFDHKAWERNEAIQVTARYNSKTLKSLNVTVKLTNSQSKDDYPVIADSEPGRHVLIYKPSSLHRHSDEKEKRDAEEIVKANSWQIRRPFARQLDTHLLGKELVDPWA